MSRIRKRRRGGASQSGAFQAINITPFTDVLLVLLIIFLIAGSSLAPTGLEVERISTESAGASQQAEILDEGTLWVAQDGSLSYLKGGTVLSDVKLSQFDRSKPISLSAHPSAPMSKVVQIYDELLKLGYSDLSLASPLELEE